MKILYKTNNIDLVRKLSYKEDKEYFELYFSRENVDKAIELINGLDDFVIVLIGINKSNVADSLLIALENLDKGTFIGTTEDILKPALLSRFDVIKELQSADYSEIINSFLKSLHFRIVTIFIFFKNIYNFIIIIWNNFNKIFYCYFII